MARRIVDKAGGGEAATHGRVGGSPSRPARDRWRSYGHAKIAGQLTRESPPDHDVEKDARHMNVNFVHHKLGHCQRGDVVEVALRGSAANVRLLDSSNFQRYRRGDKHRYHGGLAKQSPVRLRIPHSGSWHVAIDMQGLRPAQIGSGARVISRSALRPLPPISQQRPELQQLANNLAEQAPPVSPGDEPGSKAYDVFVSHAGEDKTSIVRPLANALRDRGLAVWYDEFELRIGDSLRRRIDAGIAASRFGIVVLSRAFFAKGWPAYELDGLVTRAVSGKQVLLPLWHEVSKDEVISYSPSLADKVALRTADYTVAEIAEEVAAVISERPKFA